MLIAWSDPKEIKPLAGRVLGVGGSTGFRRSAAASPAYVSGSVYLDAPDLATSNARSHGAVAIQAVIEHELGHLVGLDHVKDRKQLMYPEAGHVPTYGPGDLRGLAIEGSGSCHPEL